jgi:streptomycin 6-kinase
VLNVPPEFSRHTVEAFGQAGADWLRELPSLVADLARRWNLTVGASFDLSYSYVVEAHRSDGTEAVLRVGAPGDECARQIRALRLYAGKGACRLIEADDDRYAVLLERLRPGETLVGLARTDDEAATHVGAAVMRELWRQAPEESSFRPIPEGFSAFERHRSAHGGPGPLPAALFELADALARELLDSEQATVLLHGDLHHYNILSAERAPWLAIDPKGMIGDPGSEAGPFLLNPHQDVAIWDPNLQGRRLDTLSEELRYDRSRLRDWGIAHAVLSVCWSVEDHGHGWEKAIAAADALTRS